MDSNSNPIHIEGENISRPCGCRQCLRDRKEGTQVGDFFMPAEMTQMVLCSSCGNKRCPHANACTNSNAPGQVGSAYP